MRLRPAASPLVSRFALDPTVAFLNHGSYGACPHAVLETQARLRRELEANPVAFLARELPGRLDVARRRLGDFVGAPHEDLVFVANSTGAVNAVLRSRRWSRGDVILTTDHDYVGCRSALLEVASREGLEVRVVELPFPVEDEERIVERVVGALDSRVRLALLDHVTSATGLVMPIERLVHELESRGVEVLVDGAHAPGMLPLRLEALGASYYAGNAHKWLCAPKGSALMYVRRDRQEGLVPGTISIGTRFPRADRNPFHERFDWVGTTDPTAWLSIPSAIDFLENVLVGGIDAVRAHNRALVLEGRGQLLSVLGGAPPAPDSMIGSMVSVLLTGRPAELAARGSGASLARLLADDHGIEVPVTPFKDTWLLRITAQIYNSPEQYAYLADVLRAL